MSDWCAFIEEKARRVVDVLSEPDVHDSDVQKILKMATSILEKEIRLAVEMEEKEVQRPYTTMDCKTTGKGEVQYVVRESEDGITLRCGGCGDEHSHEIGFFAEKYMNDYSRNLE